MKVDSKIFKGIEYVQVSELPQGQREELTQSINRELYIKLLIDGKIISGCLQYKDYNKWYSDIYQPKLNASNASRDQVVVPELDIKPNLALNKF
jgi:hypothetical protein